MTDITSRAARCSMARTQTTARAPFFPEFGVAEEDFRGVARHISQVVLTHDHIPARGEDVELADHLPSRLTAHAPRPACRHWREAARAHTKIALHHRAPQSDAACAVKW
jgi:hypothetical protein